jgi:GDPmannose 4,6-dehydratase
MLHFRFELADNNLCRPTDIAISRGDPTKAKEYLGWEAKHKINDIIQLMIQAQQSS